MTDITITVKSAGDNRHKTTISTDATILQLKEQLATELDVPADRQRLIYSGKVLKDGDTIDSYNIKDGHALHLVKGAAKNGAGSSSGSASAAGNGNADRTAGAAAGASGIPHNISAGQSTFDPLAGLTSARYAGYNIPMPTLEQMGLNPDGMQIPDENQIEQMMENPMFQEGMRSMLSDPRMLDYMIQQSPQLRAMGPMAREMLQSDYFRNMMTNPQAMRSMMQFQRMMGQQGGAGAGAGSMPAPGNPQPAATDSTTTPASTTAAAGAANTTSGGASAASPAGATNTNPAAANPFQALFGGFPPAAGASGAAGAAGAGAAPAANPAALWNMLGAMSGAQRPAPPVDNRPPEEVYQTQLRQLNDMGFFDFERNVQALRRSGGSVEGAIEMLLNGAV